MKTFESNKTLINQPDQEIFNFLSNLNNFEGLMPDQITDWESNENSCSFKIPGMTTVAIKIEEKLPYSFIKMIPNRDSIFYFELQALIEKIDTSISKVQIVIMANLNPMLSMMASRPMQNLVDILAEKLKRHFEG